MRILVTGASGFIGQALVAALVRDGHAVVCASRHPRGGSGCEALAVDFESVPQAGWWRPRLAGIEAVVNAVGILRERSGQTFGALHERAPGELFRACAEAGVPFVLQVSALGADHEAQSRYHRTKKAADDVLRGLPLRAAIVQPSLVYGPGGANAALFNGMAAMPVLALPRGGDMLVQPVHVDDVVEGVMALLRAPPEGTPTIPFVGPRALTLREFIAELRRQLGFSSRLRVLRLPESVFRAAASVAGHVPGSALDRETAGMLLRGNASPPAAFTSLLGHAPRDVSRFVAP